MKPLVVIPARGGSKGIPKKNIKELGGKPLIMHTIDEARKIFSEDQILVSTDDPRIKEVVENGGLSVPFLRPKELATDSSGTYEVLIHAIDFSISRGYKPDVLVLLQPTSPFRNNRHITEALKLFTEDLDMVVSVKETRSNPYYTLFEENDNGFLVKCKELEITRRQDAPAVWEYNGAVYIINVTSILKRPLHHMERIKKYVMDEYSSIDIDSYLDWSLAEIILGDRK